MPKTLASEVRNQLNDEWRNKKKARPPQFVKDRPVSDSESGGGGSLAPNNLQSLLVWFKADTGTFQDTSFTTPAVANNDPIGGWKDQSGNGNHATQGTGSARPLLQTNQQNRIASALGDGSSQTMTFTQTSNLDGYTFFAVHKLVSLSGFLMGTNSGTIGGFRCGPTVNEFQANFNGGVVDVGLTQPLSTSVYQITIATGNDVNANGPLTHYLNGVFNGTQLGIGSFTAASALFSRNGANFANCYLGEIGLYGRTLSIQEVGILYRYLHFRWQI